MAEDYILFQRGIKKTGKKTAKDIPYYVQYRNYEGKRISPVSTGETTKTAAHAWARLHKDRIIKKSYERVGNPLKKLLTDFYGMDSKILQRRAARGEVCKEIHRKHCEAYCKNYFIPFFDESNIKSVHDITRPILRELQDYIRETGVKAKTVNSALSALRQVFRYLEDEEEINKNPFYGLKPLAELDEKEERGAFPLDKVRLAFKLDWSDKHYYLLSILAGSTGLRNSEINALRVSSIIANDNSYHVDVRNAFDSSSKTKTKAGVRKVPLHPFVYSKLLEWIEVKNLHGNDYLFWERKKGPESELKPISYSEFGLSVVEAGRKMGLNESFMNDNNITFYSWRHFYNSLLVRAGINIYKIKTVMGHTLNTSNDMTANYYKSIDNDDSDIISAVDILFS